MSALERVSVQIGIVKGKIKDSATFFLTAGKKESEQKMKQQHQKLWKYMSI